MANTLIYKRIRARGRFSFSDGLQLPHRPFSARIEQHGSGRTFLFFADRKNRLAPHLWEVGFGGKVSFVGHTGDGTPIRTSPVIIPLEQDPGRGCFELSHVVIGDTSAPYSSVELALTNLTFDGTSIQRFSLEVFVDGATIAMELAPEEDYKNLFFRLRQTASPTVTAKLKLTVDSRPVESLDSLVSDLCAALSIAQGRTIQWIERAAYSGENAIAWSEFGRTKTKNYTHGILCFDPDKQTGISLPIQRIVAALPRVRNFHQVYDLKRRIVNSWLDARQQNDFLEARTLKYVIVLEALCQLVKSKHGDIPATYVPKAVWRSTGKEFLPLIKNRLGSSSQIRADTIDNICSNSNWGNLNRASFRTILVDCLSRLGISMHDQAKRVRRVADVRNKVVHSLQYLAEEDFEELNWPAVDATHQHFLVACFVDEVILRLFGLGDRISEAWIAGFMAHRS